MKKILFTVVAVLGFTFAQAQSPSPKGLEVGQKAPTFHGVDQHGSKVNLKKALRKGPVVLFFYRGAWCPYCQRQIAEMQDSLNLVTAKGASVIAVTPAGTENIEKISNEKKVTFHILHDKKHKIMDSYGVRFEVDQDTQKRYAKHGIDFKKINGDAGTNLPIPATYIIGQDGKIVYRYFNPKYQKRASIQELLENLPNKK